MRIIKGNDDLSNCYLISRFNEIMIVDPSHGYEEIIEYVGEKNISGVLITHAHADHLGLLKDFDVPIYIHESDYELLFLDDYNGFYPKAHPYKEGLLNIILLKGNEKIPFADEFIEVIHTPGHTSGSISFYYNGMLFTGDTLFKNDVGRHDLYSGNLYNLKKSVLKLCEYPGNTKIYPGHGEQSTIRDEKKNNEYYIKWTKQFAK